MADLTDKQRKFCEEYLIDLNATQAAIRAGYSLLPYSGEKYFVYFLIDPRTDQIFYIGKGLKNRPYHHIAEVKNGKSTNAFKANRIAEIFNDDCEVCIKYFAINLTESEAFKTERELIKLIKTSNLTNISGGVRKPSEAERAKGMLAKLLSYDLWVNLRNPPEEYKPYYFKVKKTLETIAHGCT